MEKKPYTAPTITEHGSAITATRGFGGEYWEMMSSKVGRDEDVKW